jgi:outer membrane lipopolysaccharide assembly protein LptE/RlpB
MRTLLLLVGILFLVGCGYKPSAHYIKNIFDGSIFVDVRVSPKEPENATFLKDELHRMVLRRFKGELTDNSNAKNKIIASYNRTKFEPVGYDGNGYITRYKVTVMIDFTLITPKGRIKKTIVAYREKDIQGSSQFISTVRNEAIREGMEGAIDEFMAFVSAKGALEGGS